MRSGFAAQLSLFPIWFSELTMSGLKPLKGRATLKGESRLLVAAAL